MYAYDSSNPTSSLDYDMLTESSHGAFGQTTNVDNASAEVTQQTDPSTAVTTLTCSGKKLQPWWWHDECYQLSARHRLGETKGYDHLPGIWQDDACAVARESL